MATSGRAAAAPHLGTRPLRSSRARLGSTLAALVAGVGVAGLARADRPARTLDIAEYEVHGSHQLPTADLELALRPFMGPGRTLADVETARAALEKLYADKGFPSVSVAIPPQTVRGGVVVLNVSEAKVGRLRVRGARYFSPWEVKRLAPSVAEGTVPNLGRVLEDVVALNQVPDRRVTPALRAGAVPGTIDVDLTVEDALPLHGSLEVNNRHGRDTKPLRLAGSLHYDNLWQAGNVLSLSFQIAPPSNDARAVFHTSPYPDARLFLASYLARFPDVPWFTVTASGIYQDSVVDTSGATVKGSGRTADVKAVLTLPGTTRTSHTFTIGPGYKEMGQVLKVGTNELSSPLTYWPVTADYAAVLSTPGTQLQLAAGLTTNVRPLSSAPQRFDDRRYGASASFIVYRGEASLTRDLPWRFAAMVRAQGHYAPDPLVPSEQLSAGGADTVRGYLTSEVVGDFGGVGSIELRFPSIAAALRASWLNEWRWHAFADAAWLGIHRALPEQQRAFDLASTGVGTRLRLAGHLGCEADVGVPLLAAGITRRLHPQVHFRAWTDF